MNDFAGALPGHYRFSTKNPEDVTGWLTKDEEDVISLHNAEQNGEEVVVENRHNVMIPSEWIVEWVPSETEFETSRKSKFVTVTGILFGPDAHTLKIMVPDSVRKAETEV